MVSLTVFKKVGSDNSFMKYPKEFIKPDGRKLMAGGPRDLQRRQHLTQTLSPDFELIEDLKKQIEELKEIAKNKSSDILYTPEEVDEEIRKAVEAAVKETTLALKKETSKANQDLEPIIQKYKIQIVELQKHNDDLTKLHQTITVQNKELKEKILRLEEELKDTNELKKQIAVLEQTIAGKDEVIETLKSRPVIVSNVDGTASEELDRPKIDRVFVDPLDENASTGLKPNINVDELQILEKRDDIDEKVNKLKNLLGKLPTKKDI